MAASPSYKIYREKEYIGCAKYAEDAAAMVGVSGGVVKYEHRLILWREGKEHISASESYDEAAEIMQQRLATANREAYNKAYNITNRAYAPGTNH